MYKITFLTLSLLFSTSINNCIAMENQGLFKDEQTSFTWGQVKQWKSDNNKVKHLYNQIDECEKDLIKDLKDEASFSLDRFNVSPLKVMVA